METPLALLIVVAIIALLAEYMDASLGMGYGTTLTPLLLIAGFAPLAVVPAVLLGQFAGGIAGGYFHHRLENVKLNFRRQGNPAGDREPSFSRHPWYQHWSLDAKVVLILALCGIIGAVLGVVLAINISETVLKVYIGIMVLAIGITILVRRNHHSPFSWKRFTGIAILSAFNKGISGGGYGPLATGGQILSGREVKNSIASTTLAEVVICMVSFLAYLFLLKEGIHWALVASTATGSVVAGPFAALTVKKVGTKNLKLLVGVVITILGVITLAKVFIFF